MTFVRAIWTIRLQPVKPSRTPAFQPDVPDVAGTTLSRLDLDALTWHVLSPVIENQERHRRGMAAEYGEVDSVAAIMHAQRKGQPGTDARAHPIWLQRRRAPLCCLGSQASEIFK